MPRSGPAWLAVAAFASLACTVANTKYCANGGVTKTCPTDAGSSKDADARPTEGGDSRDGGEAGDTSIDLTSEAKPACTIDGDCAADGGVLLACDKSGTEAKCVQCVETKHCTDPKKPACDTKVHQCVECVGTGTECTADSKKSVCNVAAQQCVECIDDTKCTGTKPICDAKLKVCRSCAADTECKDTLGICVDFDGHCATAGEVVTLQGGACTPTASLFCAGSDAVNALSAAHPILLVRGPDAVGTLAPPTSSPDAVLILGRMNATVSAGAGDAAGIHVPAAHKVWVRDLAISGGTAGLVAEAGAELHVTRCVVTNNGKGGIKTIDSSFDITNTIIAGNMSGTDVGGVVWGGVRLGDVPQGGTGRFENNTVVDNKLIGISCKSAHDVSTDIVHGNVGGDTANCTGTICCGAGDPDPKLDASYHLQAGSPCIDKIDAAAMSLTIDIQGQPRPGLPAGKLDCGADEYVP
jgi:hypothetical protein